MILLSLQLWNALGRRQNERKFEKLSLLRVYYFAKNVILLFFSFELTVSSFILWPIKLFPPSPLPPPVLLYTSLQIQNLFNFTLHCHSFKVCNYENAYILYLSYFYYIYYLVSNFVTSLLIKCNFLGSYWFQDNFGLHQIRIWII